MKFPTLCSLLISLCIGCSSNLKNIPGNPSYSNEVNNINQELIDIFNPHNKNNISYLCHNGSVLLVYLNDLNSNGKFESGDTLKVCIYNEGSRIYKILPQGVINLEINTKGKKSQIITPSDSTYINDIKPFLH